MNTYRLQSAFTLLEMLVSLSIIVILAAISLPAARHFILQTEETILQGQLLRAIEISKREADARRVPVALCPLDRQSVCLHHFEKGFWIFLDQEEDGAIHDNQQILAVIPSQSHHGRIHWRAFPVYRQYPRFLPAGNLQSDNGTFWHCHDKLPVWAIVVNKTGRSRVLMPNKKGEFSGLPERLNC